MLTGPPLSSAAVSAITAVTRNGLPSRTRPMSILSPTRSKPMVLRSSLLDFTVCPFTEVMTSPVRMPALSAGEPSTTCDTSAPMAIPVTLAMTFGVTYMLGIDLQQVSVATLIIALGLLVDVPVVAGDGIKRGLAEGLQRRVAAWLGPTKLATAIFYATLTNIIAYLPFLLLRGNTGEFLKSLPIVMTTALLCALVVAMTFVPLLGYYIQRSPARNESALEEKRERGFYGFYNRLVGRAIQHRWSVLAGTFVFLLIGGFVASHLKAQFFPEDVQYWFYVDNWLPNDVPLTATSDAAVRAGQVVRKVVEGASERGIRETGAEHLLTSVTSFIGGGGPRFWFSIAPEATQTNYAQVIVQVRDKEATPKLIGPLQDELNKQVPGAWITVRQLQTNPVETPVEVLVTGQADTD